MSIVPAEWWLDQYIGEGDEVDMSAKLLPLSRTMWTIAVPESAKAQFVSRVPMPSSWFEVSRGLLAVTWACADPPEGDRPKQVTFFTMVENALLNALKGKRWPQGMPNPFILENVVTFRLNTYTMTDMRSHLEEHHAWDTWDREASRKKAGEMSTRAQTEARRANIARAREAAVAANRARGDESAAHVVQVADSGASRKEVAETLGVVESAVAPMVSRAKKRLNAEDLAGMGWGPEYEADAALAEFIRQEA